MKVLGITGARADWGLLAPVLAALRNDPAFDLRLAVTGQHLMSGSDSLQNIENEGFRINHQVDMGLEDDSQLAVTKAMSLVLMRFGELFDQSRPDMIMILGDRYEILAVVTAALLAKIPVAHLCGGDITEGVIDDAIRHSITKMAHLHFVSNEEAARRVIQLGEDPGRVHNVGSPGLDRIRKIPVMGYAEFFAAVGLARRSRNLLITFHPVTLADDSIEQCGALLDALARLSDVGLIFTGSNADPGGRTIDAMVQSFVAGRSNAVFHASLGSKLYFSALGNVDAVVGNSSSGLYEAPSFALPTVNIGDRQTGRLRAASVIDCAPDAEALYEAILRAFSMDCNGTANPYGDGHTGERVVAVLKTVIAPSALLHKRFMDLAA